MNRIITLGLAIGLLCSTALVATADSAEAKPWKKRVNQRQKYQQNRLKDGLKEGSLTKKEYAKLQKKQAKLAKKEAKMRHSGGGLSPKEAAKLENQQDKLSKNIYKQKNDGQDRH